MSSSPVSRRSNGSTPFARAQRQRRWPTVLLLGMLLAPIVEITVLIAMGKTFGVLPTLLALIAITVLGGWMVTREGSRTFRELRQATQTGAMPAREVADGVLILIGGAFLLLPGFVSDVIGLFFIAPPTRVFARGMLQRLIAARAVVLVPTAARQSPIRGEVVDE